MKTKKAMCYEVKGRKYVLLYAGLKRGQAHYDILNSFGQEIASSLPYEDAIEQCQLDWVRNTTFAKRRSKRQKSQTTHTKGVSRTSVSMNSVHIAEFLEFTSNDDFMLHELIRFDQLF